MLVVLRVCLFMNFNKNDRPESEGTAYYYKMATAMDLLSL